MGTLRAFVAGATGLTGKAVVRHLLARDVDAVAHVRPDSSRFEAHAKAFRDLGARVDATPWSEAAMTESLSDHGPAVVFALLGTTRKRAREVAASGGDPDGESYEAVDYGLTALLRRAAEACGAGPRFVYLSSMGVTEGTSNRYLAARARIERELREGSLPYVIARPSFITGDREERRPGEAFGAAVANAALSVVGALGGADTRDRYRSITGDALGRALVDLALDPDAAGRVFSGEDLYRRGNP